jgi:vacuolar-type H+-ATPase subunit I/STV1
LALRSICDDCLKELEAEKNASAEDIRWLKEKRRSLEKELKEVEKLEYSELPSEVFDEIQLLLLPDGTLAQERLQALKSALVRAAIGESEPPRCYKDKCEQSLFALMSAYFAEEIKHNQVVRNIKDRGEEIARVVRGE